MKIETIALVLAIVCGVFWLGFILLGTMATPMGIPFLIVIIAGILLLLMVLKDRAANSEDDYYDKNVDK